MTKGQRENDMYNAKPKIRIKKEMATFVGYQTIIEEILANSAVRTVAFECFPGVDVAGLINGLQQLNLPNVRIESTDQFFIDAAQITTKLQPVLTDDRVFGHFNAMTFADFSKDQAMSRLEDLQPKGIYLLVGVGANTFLKADVTVYVNRTKWNIQLDFKAGMPNWRADNATEEFLKKVKRAYYFEWPAGDEIKQKQLPQSEYVLDLNNSKQPKMLRTGDYLASLAQCTKQPFRLVPYFEPGVWGGQWMQEKFGVRPNEVNLAWCFDGVPEENSLLLQINQLEFEFPANDVVFFNPVELMGEQVFGRFGRDFPIRFDFLDTMGGDNLSLQVHPTLDYASRQFGLSYTQDESYYIVDCKENAFVYLGLKEGVNPTQFFAALTKSQRTGQFAAEEYVNKIPVKKHDHFLIPAGTVHCSGQNCVVLEISATPNRFTFKLWDWGRVDLDGRPRPIHLKHGKQVLNPAMTTTRVEKELVNHVEHVVTEPGKVVEQTGLHPLEPIVTHRITFTKSFVEQTKNSVTMLNLVSGSQIYVASPDHSFERQVIHFGETFIIPAAVATYQISPVVEGEECILMQAKVR
jgi:mannose-6-phosphate isomerase class I